MNARVSLKLFVVFLLTVVILLALLAVGFTVSGREAYRQQAVQAISQSYAGAQTLVGPAVALRYKEDTKTSKVDSKGVTTVEHSVHDEDEYIFPKTLTLTGTVVPSERRHGLYRVTVYELRGHLQAKFVLPPSSAERKYDAASLRLALTDVRGIVGLPTVTVNGVPVSFRQYSAPSASATPALSDDPLSRGPAVTAPTGQSVLDASLPGSSTATGPQDVSMDFVLAGTQQLSIAPTADLNNVTLTSAWRTPLFAGRFLPRTRTLDDNGFKAEWEISSLASSAQEQARSNSLQGAVDTFDVTLNQPTDPYKLSDRATKYGVLFVLLTFGGFFVFEVMKQMPIHPVQYLLVGFALALFFLLLISLSEHIEFGSAYLLSSAASIGLLSFYLSYVLRSVRRGLIFGGLMSVLFAAIYGLLRSEDNALLLGSVMLFGILAAVMIVTRRVDWYRTAPAAAAGPLPPSPVPAPQPPTTVVPDPARTPWQ